jgi:hypothetical protein
MHNQEIHDRFILFRAQGMSFNDISVNLGVARSTLILWSRQHRLEIDNQRSMNLEQLQQKYLKTYADQVNVLGQQLHAAEEELKKRSLADLPTAKLISLVDQLRQQILARTGTLTLTIPATAQDPHETKEDRIEWNA